MRPVTTAQTGTGSSSTIPLDHKTSPFNVGFGVVASGTVTYKVQHTFDECITATPTTWFDHADVITKTANADGNYAFPVRGIRVTVTAGTGSATMTVIQAGAGG
jgi:hypothetical protein